MGRSMLNILHISLFADYLAAILLIYIKHSQADDTINDQTITFHTVLT